MNTNPEPGTRNEELQGSRIGLDLGGTKIEGVLLEGGREPARVRVATPRGDYDATLDAIARVIGELDERATGAATIGIGIPGTLSPERRIVKNANSTWLIGRPLQDDLEARLRRPVRIANDANCFAMSEAIDGAAADARVVFGVIVGTGTGAGIVVDGRILEGANGIAGEWGHNPMPWPRTGIGNQGTGFRVEGGRESVLAEWPGPPCYCGRSGCIETFLSGPGLMADYALHAGRQKSPEEIAAAAADGDREADEALSRYEERMARALASVVNVLDPDAIVLGGGMSNIGRLYATVPALLGRYVFNRGAEREILRTRVVRAQYGDSSGVRGAARLWGS